MSEYGQFKPTLTLAIKLAHTLIKNIIYSGISLVLSITERPLTGTCLHLEPYFSSVIRKFYGISPTEHINKTVGN